MVKAKNYVAGFAIALIFGFSFLFTKGALDVLSLSELLFLRFSVATATMLALRAFRVIKLDYKGKNLRPLLVIALLQPILYFVFETIGISLSSTSTAGIILSIIPVAAALLGIPLLGEKPQARAFVFIALSAIGVAAVALGKSGMIPGLAAENPLGLLALFGAVVAAGFYNVLARKHSGVFSPSETTFAMMATGAVSFGLWHLVESIARASPFISPNAASAVPALLYLGCVSSVGAFLLMNINLAALPASQATVFLNLVTVVAVFAGWAFRGESVGILELGGTACILVGVWGANRVKKTPELLVSETM